MAKSKITKKYNNKKEMMIKLCWRMKIFSLKIKQKVSDKNYLTF